ncbi:MAG: Zn-ribbon domain-containing OB-fold protein [Thermoprotei archaeon]
MRYSIPRFWRERHSRYRLKAAKCRDCGKVNYPPSQVCRYCGSRNLEEIYLSNEKAKLLTWTVIYTPPSGFEERKPVIIGIVETHETHTRILAPITDILPHELKEGLILEPVLRRISEDREAGLIHYGIAYRPAIK